jgi:catechol 2,3-dioxygenase-like lactoylglutathione lyase family enzyme
MIDSIDHLVLKTAHREACIDFYTRVLGMTLQQFGAGRIAFQFGSQKINLHEKGREFEPKAALPTPGALDLCFIADRPLDRSSRGPWSVQARFRAFALFTCAIRIKT